MISPSNTLKAILCMILAYISIALMGIFVKLASDSLPSSEILFARFLIGTLFLLPSLAKTRDFRVDLKQWHFLVLRNLAGICSMLLMFYSLKNLPVSIAILLMNTSALFVPLLLLFLKEKTPLNMLACCVLGFIGVAIILLTNLNGTIAISAIFIGLAGAMLAAMAFISLQELNKHNSPQNIVFYFHLLGSLLLPLFFFPQWQFPDTHAFVLMLLVGGFGLIFQLLLTRAFKYAPANVVTPFAFTGVIFSGLCDWLFWDNAPNGNFWLGTLVIIIAVSSLAKIRSRKH